MAEISSRAAVQAESLFKVTPALRGVSIKEKKGIDISDKYIEKVWVQNPDKPRAGAWVPK